MKHKYSGKLIVVEGTDGSGKQTQSNELVQRLTEAGKKTTRIAFPRYEEFWGQLISRYLSGEFGEHINSYLSVLPYLFDQTAAQPQIKSYLEQGYYVICDRYYTSNFLYQTRKFDKKSEQVNFTKWLEEAAYKQLNGVEPDLVIGLYADPLVSAELMKNREQKIKADTKDIYEKNLQLQKNVADELVNLCESNANWHLINCTKSSKILPVETIANKVWDVINKYL